MRIFVEHLTIVLDLDILFLDKNEFMYMPFQKYKNKFDQVDKKNI